MTSPKDLIMLPTFAPIVAQTIPLGNEWERLGTTGLAIAATVFIWRYFNIKQDEKERASISERDRLLKIANDKNQEIIELLKQQILDDRNKHN